MVGAALIVCSAFGSQTTMSASLPGAMVPFLGYMPKIRAGAVDVISTNRFRLILRRSRRNVDQLHPVLDAWAAVRESS